MKNKIALITGASRGLGAALSERLSETHHIIAVARTVGGLEDLDDIIKSKNLKYSFFRFDKEKNIQLFNNGGWHFNNVLKAEEISHKLKTFAHSEFSGSRFSDVSVIKNKIENKIDLFERGHIYKKVDLDKSFPSYLIENLEKYKHYIL